MSVGKSCIAFQFVHGSFNGIAEPTIGLVACLPIVIVFINFTIFNAYSILAFRAAFCSRCIQVKNVVCKFQIWDTAGMEKVIQVLMRLIIDQISYYFNVTNRAGYLFLFI